MRACDGELRFRLRVASAWRHHRAAALSGGLARWRAVVAQRRFRDARWGKPATEALQALLLAGREDARMRLLLRVAVAHAGVASERRGFGALRTRALARYTVRFNRHRAAKHLRAYKLRRSCTRWLATASARGRTRAYIAVRNTRALSYALRRVWLRHWVAVTREGSRLRKAGLRSDLTRLGVAWSRLLGGVGLRHRGLCGRARGAAHRRSARRTACWLTWAAQAKLWRRMQRMLSGSVLGLPPAAPAVPGVDANTWLMQRSAVGGKAHSPLKLGRSRTARRRLWTGWKAWVKAARQPRNAGTLKTCAGAFTAWRRARFKRRAWGVWVRLCHERRAAHLLDGSLNLRRAHRRWARVALRGARKGRRFFTSVKAALQFQRGRHMRTAFVAWRRDARRGLGAAIAVVKGYARRQQLALQVSATPYAARVATMCTHACTHAPVSIGAYTHSDWSLRNQACPPCCCRLRSTGGWISPASPPALGACSPPRPQACAACSWRACGGCGRRTAARRR